MDEIFKALADMMREYGLVGLVIGALGYGWYKLANLYHEAQTARIQDGRDAITALNNNTNSLRELIELVKTRKER